MKTNAPFLKALRPWIVPIIVALLLVGTRSRTSPFFFEITLSASAAGVIQIFYDVGSGHNEAHSVRAQPKEIGKFASYRFRLPEGTYRSLRFDPLDRQATIAFSDAKILRRGFWSAQDQVVANIPASRFQIANQISSFKVQGDLAQIVTAENANDPILVVPFDPPLSLKFDRSRKLAETGLAFVIVTVVTWFLLVLINNLYARWQEKIALRGRRIVLWTGNRPYSTVTAMAVFAAVLSSHPVVFFGKSFVSPNHGTALLYEKYPTLPGYASSVIEDVKGADVGALMWAHLPYSIVQSRALYEDAELPLWNRFNSAGTPLLGQGQSMLGDPLHMVVLLAKGASWAWDIKFVAAKMLFALGLGLLVHTLTRRLAISLLLTFSSAFIGFFAFRFNHPAIFSMGYAPWILYFWVRVVQLPADKLSTAVFWLSGLILANWTVMNSGTAKEAYMLLVFLNLTGLLIFLLWKEERHAKLRKGVRLLLAQTLFVLISAPIWFTFLDNLRKSYSSYNVPAAIQIPPAHFIGIFDDIFYRQLVSGEGVILPAANVLILIGVTWAALRVRQLMALPAFLAIGFGAAISFSLAFGTVPPTVITQIPFLGNVVHVGNTFSVVLIVHLIVLAGFGMHACWERCARKEWPADLAVTILMLALLLALYLSSAPADKSSFFRGYVVSLLVGFVAFPILARSLVQKKATPAVVILFLVCLVALHWRHGMYLKTGVDDYVMNPQIRVDLQPESTALNFIKHESAEPFRSVGFGANLFPGYNAAIGVESISGPDALINPFYHEFIRLLPVQWGWGWRLVVSQENVENLKPVYDFLNVKYYLSLPDGKSDEIPQLRHDGRFDLDVYRSDTVWPRAFFTNAVSAYSSPREFFSMILHSNSHPFAAVDEAEFVHKPSLQSLTKTKQREVIPATSYKLTNNTTTFTVNAPGKGIIVLTEAYFKDDFRVTVNGRPVSYFRVNHAFRGVAVDAPGTYTIVYSYWPRYLSLLLLISAAGLTLLVTWLAYTGYRLRWNTPRTFSCPQ